MTWAPAAGAVDDGAYTWALSATDGWGNGPLAASGEVDVDTQAPDVTVGGDTSAIPLFTPNGDGSRDSVAFTVGASEPGSVVATVRNGGGDQGRQRLRERSADRTCRSTGTARSAGATSRTAGTRSRSQRGTWPGNTGDRGGPLGRRLRGAGLRDGVAGRLLPAGRRRDRANGHVRVPARRPGDGLVDDRRRGRHRRAHPEDRRGARRRVVLAGLGRTRRRRRTTCRVAPTGPSCTPRTGRWPRGQSVAVFADAFKVIDERCDAGSQGEDHGHRDDGRGARRAPASRGLPAGDRRLPGHDEPRLAAASSASRSRSARAAPARSGLRVYGSDAAGGAQASNLYLPLH